MNPFRPPEQAASLAASLLVHAAILAGLLVQVLSGTPAVPAAEPMVVDLVLADAAGSVPSGGGETAPADAAPEMAEETPPPDAEEAPTPAAEPETAAAVPESPPVPETAPAAPAPARKPRPPASNPAPRPAPAGAGSGTAAPAAAAASSAPAAPAAPASAGEPDSPPRPAGGNPVPAYPRSAQRAGVEGTVLVRVTVRPDGTAGTAEVAASSGDAALDAAARTAVAGWRFVPAMRGGVPVPAVIDVPVRFQLTGRRSP